MSTLLLIPWIIFGFKHPHYRYLGLTQTKKSFARLLFLEITLWTVLFLLLDKPEPTIAGQGSFAWMYMLIYEKGIIPIWLISESIDSSLCDRIDSGLQFIYLLVALCVDYLLLFLISPRLTQMFKLTKTTADK